MFGKKKEGSVGDSQENRNILVADDDERILNIYRGLFETKEEQEDAPLSIDAILRVSDEKQSFNMTIFDQGYDAVMAVEEGLKRGEHFTCALLDVRMPPGIGGIESARRIREMDPNIFIAIVTAYTDRLPEEVAQVLGGNFTMIRKPFYGDDLVDLVENYIQVWNQQHRYMKNFL